MGHLTWDELEELAKETPFVDTSGYGNVGYISVFVDNDIDYNQYRVHVDVPKLDCSYSALVDRDFVTDTGWNKERMRGYIAIMTVLALIDAQWVTPEPHIVLGEN